MKEYPSIPREFQEIPGCYIFDKIDGSNIRGEWTKKGGWVKFGTRHRLLDASDEIFGKVPDLWRNTIGEPLAKLARDNRWESAIFFAEYMGYNSFAGTHSPTDNSVCLTLFDINPFKKGILGPREYLAVTKNVPVLKATCLGIYNWTRGLVENVRANNLYYPLVEGVVGKSGSGHKLIMTKAKTQQWIDKVYASYAKDTALKIIES